MSAINLKNMKKRTIDKIQEKLNPKETSRVLKSIQKVELPSDLQKWVDEYNTVGDRDIFLWKWLYKINCTWYYIDLQEEYMESLAKVKTVYNMFIVLLDDVAEDLKREDLLEALLLIPFDNDNQPRKKLNKKDETYYKFSCKVWDFIVDEISKYPRFDDYKDAFEYDNKQFVNAVEYSNLVIKFPTLVNYKEHWLYIPHSMQILIDFDLDMMCAEEPSDNDLGKSRHAALLIQELGRIGNWVSTWKREALENDYTSAVAAYAIDNGYVNNGQLVGNNKEDLVESIESSGAEEKLLEVWEEKYHELYDISKKSELVNDERILDRARYLIRMHLTSKGYK